VGRDKNRMFFQKRRGKKKKNEKGGSENIIKEWQEIFISNLANRRRQRGSSKSGVSGGYPRKKVQSEGERGGASRARKGGQVVLLLGGNGRFCENLHAVGAIVGRTSGIP